MQQNTTTHLSGLNLLIEQYYVAYTQKKKPDSRLVSFS